MSKGRTEAAPFAEIERSPAAAPIRRVLTIGNRTTSEIGRRLAIGWQHDHIWYANWPSLGGDPLELDANLADPVSNRIRAEAQSEIDKSLTRRIADGRWDVVVMSTASSVWTAYLVDGTACIPDFTAPPWLTDIDLAGGRRPTIKQFSQKGRRIDWLDPGFVALAKSGFARFYERVLKQKIKRGQRVFVHRQLPTRWAMTPQGLEQIDPPDAHSMVQLSNDLADHAARFRGVSIIDTLDALNFTSDDAIDGRGPLNPIGEQFVYLACQIAREMNDPLEGKIAAHHMLECRRERIALEWQRVGDTRQREKDLEAIVRSLIDRAAALERELLATRRTLSWRVTKPLRAVRGLMGSRRSGRNVP